jgi:hypothetical protein
MATVHLPPVFEEFFLLLNDKKSKYILIGDYAGKYYGYAQATADLDIWIAVLPEDAENRWSWTSSLLPACAI